TRRRIPYCAIAAAEPEGRRVRIRYALGSEIVIAPADPRAFLDALTPRMPRDRYVEHSFARPRGMWRTGWSLVLRPVALITHLLWAWLRGSDEVRYQTPSLVSYPGIPRSPGKGLSPSGDSRRKGARSVANRASRARRCAPPVSINRC